MRTLLAAGVVAAALAGGPAAAGEADVVQVVVHPAGDGTYTFDVTIRSNETGWDGYADRFEILAPDGTVLGERILLHPHVDEQPFTRSLDGVAVPPGTGEVTVRAHHSAHGYDGETVTVSLP